MAKYSLDSGNKQVYGARAKSWDAIANGNMKTLRKSITMDDFLMLKKLIGDKADAPKYHISDQIIDCIFQTLENEHALSLFRNIRILNLGEKKVFDTVLVPVGTWYTAELQINGSFFDGVPLDVVQTIIKNSKNTVCESLEECIFHEIIHAKAAEKAMKSVIDRLDATPGIPEISDTAAKDMLEALSEAGVLRKKGLYDTISKESRELLNEAAKELGLW
mgnify:CR=1 FL=1